MGQADFSLGDGVLAPYPGLAATLAHGMDFFDRPSGVVIPQFASSPSASLGGQSSDGTQNPQAPADQGDAATTPTTSTLDYDHFSDPVASSSPAASAYDQFSDAVASAPRSVGGFFSDAVASSQVGRGTSDDSSGSAASDGAPRSVGGLFSDAVASSQVEPGTGNNDSLALASPQTSAAEKSWWSPRTPTPEALAAADEVARADPLYFDPTQPKLVPTDVLRTLGNDLTFGGADHLAAYWSAKTGIWGVYGDYEGNLRGQQYQTEHADPKSAGLGELGSLLVGGGAANKLAHVGLKLGRKLLPYAGRFIPELGRLTTTAEDAGTLAGDAKLAGNTAQGASDAAGDIAATNSGNATSAEAAAAEPVSAGDAAPREALPRSTPDQTATPGDPLPSAPIDPSKGIDVALQYRQHWTPLQRSFADAKVRILTAARTIKSKVQRVSRSAAARFRAQGGSIPHGYDVDHTVDLQLGGSDTISNMLPIDANVNRSLGAQIWYQIKKLPIGTVINKFTIGD